MLCALLELFFFPFLVWMVTSTQCNGKGYSNYGRGPSNEEHENQMFAVTSHFPTKKKLYVLLCQFLPLGLGFEREANVVAEILAKRKVPAKIPMVEWCWHLSITHAHGLIPGSSRLKYRSWAIAQLSIKHTHTQHTKVPWESLFVRKTSCLW